MRGLVVALIAGSIVALIPPPMEDIGDVCFPPGGAARRFVVARGTYLSVVQPQGRETDYYCP